MVADESSAAESSVVRETPRYGHAAFPMRRCEKDGFWERDDIAIGDFYWTVAACGRTLWVMIPCPGLQGGTPGALRPIICPWSIGYRNDSGAQWSWDGNEDKPTLTPSLHAVGLWHGWVRNGELVEA